MSPYIRKQLAGSIASAFFFAGVVPAYATSEATLEVSVVDAVSQVPIACSVRVTDANGRIVLHTPAYSEGFRCPGGFSEVLPPGPTQLEVWRGFEYASQSSSIDLRAGETNELRILLRRSVDLRARGWYAGDSHAHMIHGERTIPVSFDDVALAAQAEDLQSLSVSHAWSLEAASPENLDALLGPRSSRDCLLTWNLEAPKNYHRGDARRCLGHCWSLGMRGRTPEGQDVIPLLLAASAADYQSNKPSFANFESHRFIHEQGGVVSYTHPLRWWTGPWGGQGGYPRHEQVRISNMAVELPLDLLLGPTFDGLDVITGAGELQANAKAFRLWSLLLNQGYRLAATGSSDACFDRPNGATPGAARTYTYLADGFSLSNVASAIAAGNTFATTGPLLLVEMDQQPPGSTFVAEGGEHLMTIEAWASGSDAVGLQRLELFRNGETFASWPLSPPVTSWVTNLPIAETKDAWYCVRAWGGSPQRQRAISGAFFFQTDSFVAPQPVRCRISARIIDAETGEKLSGHFRAVAYAATLPRVGAKHPFEDGFIELEMSGTARLQAVVRGYQTQTLSPFFDDPELLRLITTLGDEDLLNWKTYETVRDRLRNVQLTFRLQRDFP